MARKKRMQWNDRFARREKKKLPSLSPCRFFFLFFPLFLRLPWSRARRERRRERALAGRRALSAQKSREREKRASKLVEVFFFGSERGRGATDEGHIKTYEPINEKRSNSLSLSLCRPPPRTGQLSEASFGARIFRDLPCSNANDASRTKARRRKGGGGRAATEHCRRRSSTSTRACAPSSSPSSPQALRALRGLDHAAELRAGRLGSPPCGRLRSQGKEEGGERG